MVQVYIKERINNQTTICAGGKGITGNTTYLGVFLCLHLPKLKLLAYSVTVFCLGTMMLEIKCAT